MLAQPHLPIFPYCGLSSFVVALEVGELMERH